MIETKFKKRIPDGWEVKQLNQVLSLFGRIGFRGYNVTDLVQESKGAISLSPSNIENGIVTFNKCTYLSWEKYEESPEIMVEEGDILLVKTGSTYGKIGYVESLPWPSTINPQYVVLKKFKCNSRVLAYLLEQKDFQDQIESITSGGAIPTMSQAKILTCTVTLPSKEEQSRIATALSDIDDLIATTKKLIEKKRNIKEGAMQELLSGKRRLPGFSGEWVEISFNDIYKYASEGGTPDTSKAEYYNMGNLPFVKIEDTAKKYIDSVGSYITQEGLSNSSAWLIPSNNIIFTNGATVGNVAINRIPVTTKQGILGVLLKDAYDLEFIYYILSFSPFQKEVHNRESGGTFATIILKNLDTIPLFLPRCKEEQAAIAQVLSDMDSEIQSLESRVIKYQSLKQGMMQQLLTGKIRLI